jgi:3'(2'), 5'-bisphosphate nucleotidase
MSEKLLKNPGALVNMTRRIAVDAGEIIMDYFDMLIPNDIQQKDDGSPVSLADQKAEELITRRLTDITPGIPIIGEEAKDAGNLPDVSGSEYFWLVDPLDGTKEFLRGSEDFTVNIALIHKGAPVLGVVYQPAAGILYAGHGEHTAIKWSQDTDKEKEIAVRMPPEKGITVVSSRSHGKGDRLDNFLEEFKVQKHITRGSSLKICVIAEGKADLYPRLGPTCEWDTAAGHAVINAAGGCLTKLDGSPFTYGGADPDWLNPEFVVSGFDWFNTEDNDEEPSA